VIAHECTPDEGQHSDSRVTGYSTEVEARCILGEDWSYPSWFATSL
jgi:hypothetical protein